MTSMDNKESRFDPCSGCMLKYPLLSGFARAVSSGVEHCLHTAGATGSTPVPPTTGTKELRDFVTPFFCPNTWIQPGCAWSSQFFRSCSRFTHRFAYFSENDNAKTRQAFDARVQSTRNSLRLKIGRALVAKRFMRRYWRLALLQTPAFEFSRRRGGCREDVKNGIAGLPNATQTVLRTTSKAAWPRR
jgi:hypothetical protein